MPKASNLFKKEIFNKINSERQYSNPKSALLKRNNSEIYKTLYNSNLMNLVNISKPKLNSNITHKKGSIVKQSINLFSEIKKDLVSPPKKLEIQLAKPNLLKETSVKPYSKNASITSRKSDLKPELKVLKNLIDIKKPISTKTSSSSRLKSKQYILIKK